MKLTEASIITAMVTPFADNGEIDFAKLPGLIEHLLAHHSEGLVVAGTTGESPTLTHEEELKLFQEVIRIVAGRVPIICGVGTNDTKDTVRFVKEVAKIEGVAAGLCVVPYYNKPNQEGLYQHYKAIAEASDLPIILYNVPGRTITSLSPDTIVRLSLLPNIIGIKECAGLEQIAEVIERTADDFIVFSGEDALAYAAKLTGAQGVVSVASHLLGDDIYAMYQFIKKGNLEDAARVQRQFLPKAAACFSVPSPAPIKAVLNHMGIPVGGLRLPLVSCTPEEEKRILEIVNIE